MAQVDPELRRAWRDNPGANFDLIIKFDGDAQERTALLKEKGANIRRTFRLTNSIAIRCTGNVAQTLTRSRWIRSIETDGPIRAMGR